MITKAKDNGDSNKQMSLNLQAQAPPKCTGRVLDFRSHRQIAPSSHPTQDALKQDALKRVLAHAEALGRKK